VAVPGDDGGEGLGPEAFLEVASEARIVVPGPEPFPVENLPVPRARDLNVCGRLVPSRGPQQRPPSRYCISAWDLCLGPLLWITLIPSRGSVCLGSPFCSGGGEEALLALGAAVGERLAAAVEAASRERDHAAAP
jgi:hypothetical protein